MFEILFLDETDNTMAAMSRMLDSRDVPEFTALSAAYQHEGIGQDGKHWESARATNLLATVLLRPVFLNPSRQFLLSKVFSLAACDTVLNAIPDAEVKVKWPNDIYIGDKKAAGILIRHELKGEEIQHSLLGIGLNVNQKEFLSDAPNPVSLFNIDHKTRDTQDLLERFMVTLKVYYDQLRDGNAGMIDELYHQRLYRLGEPAKYFIQGREIKAHILGVDEFGRLLLEEKDRKHICDLKEVRYG